MRTQRSFLIGLVFPELYKHDLKYFSSILRKKKNSLDLIVFPEAFENVQSENEIYPETLRENGKIKKIQNKYQKLCEEIRTPIILGLSVDYNDKSVNAGGNDQYCFIFQPDKKTTVYHKHTTSRYKAFYDAEWSIRNSFPVLKIKNIPIGVSICHDMFNGLIPKLIKKKGAKIWVNISYQNVRPHIWESMMQTRSLENGFISLCALHRNKNIANPQSEPYAFSPKGKIKLRDSTTNKLIDDLPFDNKTGRIYVLDMFDYQTSAKNTLKPRNISTNAEVLSLKLTKDRKVNIYGGGNNYVIKKIKADDFIHSPDKLWKEFLRSQNQIPLFLVLFNSQRQWKKLNDNIHAIIRGRIVEFSTLFLFLNRNTYDIYACAYRSSSYKDTRLYYPKKFPVDFDKRYLKGITSTLKISQNDPRCRNDSEYYSKIRMILNYLK